MACLASHVRRRLVVRLMARPRRLRISGFCDIFTGVPPTFGSHYSSLSSAVWNGQVEWQVVAATLRLEGDQCSTSAGERA